MSIEYKALGQSLEHLDIPGRTVYGYFSSVGTWDEQGDLIEPGAFSKTIKERGPESSNPLIFHLYQHQPDKILGKPKVLKEDSKGLYFETSIAKTALGDEVLALYQEGILNQHSIGFAIPKGKSEIVEGTVNGWPKRVIKEIKLYEGSTVTWGANPKTPTLGIKTELVPIEAIKSHIDRLDYILRKGELPDADILTLAEIWRSQLLAHVEALTKSEEPTTPVTPEDAEPQSEDPAAALKDLRDYLKSLQ